MVELVTQLFINKIIQNVHKKTILIMLVMDSLQKDYHDIAVTMTGFGLIKLIAHCFRYLDSQKNSKFQVIPNIKDSEFEEIKCNINQTMFQYGLKHH